MATYTNLAGGGAQGLSSGVTRLLVDVVTFGKVMSTGRATPTNYFHLGLLRLGNQGSYYPAIPIDAAQMVIDVPQGVTTLGYSLQDTTTITVIEQFGTSPWSRPAPYDRNPVPLTQTVPLTMAGGAALATAFLYTVPAGRILALASARAELVRTATATTAGVSYGAITISGQYAALAWLAGGGFGASFEDAMNGGTMYLPAGTVVAGVSTNGDVGGQISYLLAASGTLFDA